MCAGCLRVCVCVCILDLCACARLFVVRRLMVWCNVLRYGVANLGCCGCLNDVFVVCCSNDADTVALRCLQCLFVSVCVDGLHCSAFVLLWIFFGLVCGGSDFRPWTG